MSPLSYEALLSDENARGATERGANRCQGFYGGSADDGDEQATARSKLVWALLICCTAVLVEVVGGLLAHSLALLTDAAHLLSDLSGYLIGLFALWAVSLQASQKSSFGYHRVEILGALLSILVIWAVTGVLVVEAINRMYNPQPVDGKVMFAVAVFGLGVNLLLLSVLGAHGHSHGGGGCGGGGGGGAHGHAHSHGSGAPASPSSSPARLTAARRSPSRPTPPPPPASPPPPTAASSWVASGQGHDHNQACGAHGHAVHHAHSHNSSTSGSQYSCGAEREEAGGGVRTASSSLSSSSFASFVGFSNEQDNINVRAAALHVVGDLVQSVGVILASVVVWVKPSWSIADPICTLLFAMLVLFTTWGMLREIFDVLMERTPKGVNIPEVKQALYSIDGVEGVHCFHVWALTTGKFLASAHVRVAEGTHDTVLADVERVLASHLGGACHTTIQVTARHQCCTAGDAAETSDGVGV